MKNARKYGEPLRLLLAVLMTGGLCYMYFSQESKVAYAQDEKAAVQPLGQNLARCLSAKDWSGLGGITETPYFNKIRPQLESLQSKLGQFKCLNKSIQILDGDTACLYLKCTAADVKYLCMVTCSKINGQWKVSCFSF